MNMRRWTLTPLVVVLGVAAIGCSNGKKSSTAAGSGAQTSSGTVATGALSIHIKNFTFSPNNPTVKVGAKVTWMNDDSTTHTASSSSPAGIFDTMNIGSNKSGSFTFTTAGTFNYICDIHQYMKGTVTVVQ